MKRSVLVGAVLMVIVAACGSSTDSPTTVPENPATTQAADTTQAPGTTVAGEEGEDSDTPWWLLIMVIGALLILVVVFVSRGSKKSVVVAPHPVSWKDNARAGYANARWLYDAMTEDLAVWRGNALSTDSSDEGTPVGTSLANTWQQLEGRMGKASDELYALEGSAPNEKTSQMAGATVSTMRTLRSTVDARANARLNYRTLEAANDTDASVLSEARESEVRSSRNLAEARSAYGAALTNLSTLL